MEQCDGESLQRHHEHIGSCSTTLTADSSDQAVGVVLEQLWMVLGNPQLSSAKIYNPQEGTTVPLIKNRLLTT